jgi:hypothetical protein
VGNGCLDEVSVSKVAYTFFMVAALVCENLGQWCFGYEPKEIKQSFPTRHKITVVRDCSSLEC